MTEVQRTGHLGLVHGAPVGANGIHVLHIVPHSFSAPDFRYHGSTKDFAGRPQYFRDREVGFDTFHHRKNVDTLKSKLTALELADYTHIIFDGSFTDHDWHYVKTRWPNAKLILRSHNLELPHRKDTCRALAAAAATDDLVRQSEDKRDAHRNRRIFFERDVAAAKYAHVILSIEGIKPSARYWSRLGFQGEVLEAPYFLPEGYVEEINAKLDEAGPRRSWVVCVMSAQPGPLTYHALMRFHKAVKSLGERKVNWRFRATGRHFWVKNHADFSTRVKPLGIVDDLMGLLTVSRAVAVLSELGRGFKTKILEAILCGDWILVNATVFSRLPEVVKPYCLVVDLESPFGFDEALERIQRKQWPGGDPNAVLQEQNYAALECALFGERSASGVGATLSAPPGGRRKSVIAYWSDEDVAVTATFCTVLTPLHKRVAAHNFELNAALNPHCQILWNVVDNHDVHLNDKRVKAFLRQLAETRGKVGPDLRQSYMQKAKEEYYDYGDIQAYLPGAKVFNGPSLEETFAYFLPQLNSADEEQSEHRRLLTKFLASYHHAAGLNIALENVTTRYAVVIDPDLYVIRPNWLQEVIDHMSEHDLAVFGVPWNPRWYQKFRDFPCTHLMVIDLQKCQWRRDMLAPDLVRAGAKYVSKFWLEFPQMAKAGWSGALQHLFKNLSLAISEDRRQRRTIGASRDTGFSLLEEFKRDPRLKAEVATPVFTPSAGFMPTSVTPLQRVIDRLAPDRRSYLSKRPGSFTTQGFDAFGLPDTRSLGWEEFLWKGQPFAFHVRGELHRQPIGRMDDVEVLNKLNALLAKIGRPPLTDRTIGGADLAAPTATTSWAHLDAALARSTAPETA